MNHSSPRLYSNNFSVIYHILQLISRLNILARLVVILFSRAELISILIPKKKDDTQNPFYNII